MTDDIPEHLIDAVWRAQGGSLDVRKGTFAQQMVRAVLAALRPEDAHLVPAWETERKTNLDYIVYLTNECRAKIERLEAQVAGDYYIALSKKLDAEIKKLQAERDAARAEVKRQREAEISARTLRAMADEITEARRALD